MGPTCCFTASVGGWLCRSRWLEFGVLRQNACPFASQLAFVWDLSAWLTLELRQRWLPYSWLSDRGPEDEGATGEEFWWGHLLLRPFISALYPSASVFRCTPRERTKTQTHGKHIWCWVSRVAGEFHLLSAFIFTDRVYKPDKSRCFFSRRTLIIKCFVLDSSFLVWGYETGRRPSWLDLFGLFCYYTLP